MHLELPRGRRLDLRMPVVMGVLNLTPDSFSDGGRHSSIDAALDAALEMVRDGAGIIDIGGESTRPGALPVSVEEEARRVLPVIERLRTCSDVVISIDTRHAATMRAACIAGADLINDVEALRTDAALEAAVSSGAAICLMHMQGDPRTMQVAPHYDDPVAEVHAFLRSRIEAVVARGVPAARLLVDPGFGFGKRLEHNLALLASMERFATLGVPLLVGMSRKGMLGELTGRPVEQRAAAGVAAAAVAVLGGAAVVRTHDVAATVDAVRVAHAVRDAAQAMAAAS